MAAAAAAEDDELRRQAMLREACGDSSDSDSDDEPVVGANPPRGRWAGREQWSWEAVEGVKGLWLCAAFLSADEQSHLLTAIRREGWLSDARNQAMRFGDLPSWAVELSALIHEAICVGDVDVGCGCKHPIFHVDLMCFDDGIAIVSLEPPCVMHFSRAEQESGHGESTKDPVYLNPGSLVLMSGDARYLWKHEINRKPGAQRWGGRELEQQIRTSITLRKLLASPN